MDIQSSSITAQMHGTFLDRQIQRTNRNLLLVSLILIVAVVGYAVIERRYLYNFFADHSRSAVRSSSPYSSPARSRDISSR
jgi:hypothetical protein